MRKFLLSSITSSIVTQKFFIQILTNFLLATLSEECPYVSKGVGDSEKGEKGGG